MRKLALLVTALMMGTLCYAGTSSFAKNSPSLNKLVSAWKSRQAVGSQEHTQRGLTMYGGDDVSPKTTLISPTAIA